MIDPKHAAHILEKWGWEARLFRGAGAIEPPLRYRLTSAIGDEFIVPAHRVSLDSVVGEVEWYIEQFEPLLQYLAELENDASDPEDFWLEALVGREYHRVRFTLNYYTAAALLADDQTAPAADNAAMITMSRGREITRRSDG